jgi:hypothetical protein
MLLLMGNAGVVRRSPDPDGWRRLLTLALEGLTAR